MDKDVTGLLLAVSKGDSSKIEALLTILDKDLRSRASRFLSRKSAGRPFEAAALIEESFLKLIDQARASRTGKTHFMVLGAQSMRRVLVDHARANRRGAKTRTTPDRRDEPEISPDRPGQILAVDQALTRLSTLDATHARILECRLFGGMTFAGIAKALGVAPKLVERDWAMIRAWLLKELAQC